MAKKDAPAPEHTQALATADVNDDLMIPDSFDDVMVRPKSLDTTDKTGTENITRDEIRLPRLAIAQGLSYEMQPGDSRYIETLKLGDMFNDLTSEVYGKDPLVFVPCYRVVRRIEFASRESGGGIIDADVSPTDPRCRWTVENGQRIPPKATRFTDFVILLLRKGKEPEPIVLSIKDTNKWNRRASDNLTTFIAGRGTAIFTGLYKLEVKTEKNTKGTFGIYVVKQFGWLPTDAAWGAKVLDGAKSLHMMLDEAEKAGNKFTTSRDTTDDAEDESFDTQKMEEDAANAKDPGM